MASGRPQHELVVEQPSNDHRAALPRLMALGAGFGFASNSLLSLLPLYLFRLSALPDRFLLFYLNSVSTFRSASPLSVGVPERPIALRRLRLQIPVHLLVSAESGEWGGRPAIRQASCGASICLFTFDQLRALSVLLLGVGAALILPAFVFFTMRLQGR